MPSRGKGRAVDEHRGNRQRVKKPLSRKERRKQERNAKKQRKVAQFYSKLTHHTSSLTHQKEEGIKPVRTQAKKPTEPKNETNLARLQRKRALEASNKREDVEISRLEKLLKLKKRKKLPSSFREDGLDYILDLTDKSGQFDWGTLSSDSDHENSGDSEPEEFSHSKHKVKASKPDHQEPTDTEHSSSKRVRFAAPDESDDEGSKVNEGAESDSDGYEESDGREGFDFDSFEDESETGEDSEGSVASDSGEDVGGVNCDFGGAREGEDPREGDKQKYVPPHLRGSKEGENVSRLQKLVQGLINRLSESNLKSIATQLEQMYQENSRNDMSSALSNVLLKVCTTAARLTDRFAMEHALILAILHSHIGQEVGAFMIQKLAQRLDTLLKDSPHTHSTKECSCVLMIIAFLYNFRVIHCGLVYDIIRRLLETMSERNIELLLILLKHTGMEIRRDDASSLKDIILLIQQKAASSESPLAQSSRVKFMLETISALKTNNARKIPNYDPSLLEHMKRLLRGSLRSNGSLDEGQLKISLNDLLSADTRGRWWVVGSAWSGRDPAPQQATLTPVNTEMWVLELARKQRMTTDVRKTVFSVVMTSEDYADAFEKLIKLGLTEVQEREVIHVLVDCCLQESAYNPYYAFLGQKLCEFKRSHQVTFQYSLWDRFKVLESLSKVNKRNLVSLLSHLISTKALSLAVLRVVEFVELGPTGVKFYKSLLSNLLTEHPEDTTKAVFARLTPLAHLKTFRDKLLVFMKHYLGRDKSSQLLKDRLRIAQNAMRTDGHLF